MQTRSILSYVLPLSAALILGTLGACDGADSGQTKEAEAEKIAAAETTREQTMMEDATEMVTATAEETALNLQRAAAEVIYIDASSAETFTASIEAIRTALPPADQDRLTAALASLAAPSIAPAAGQKEGGEVPFPTEKLSTEEMVFKAFGEKLDGFNFDDLIVFADMEG